jgi:glycosyltransferase involved in cell wall biosynthesis
VAARLRILVAHNVPAARTTGMSRIMTFSHDPLVAQGHTVDYVTTESIPTVYNGRWGRFTFPWYLYQKVRQAAINGQPYHIVNVHEPSGLWLVLRRSKLGGAKIVAMTHGVENRAWQLALTEHRLGRSGPSGKSRLIYPTTSLWQSYLTLSRANHICCLNFEDHTYLQHWLRRPASQITRIYPAAAPIYAQAAVNRDYQRATRLLFAATWRKNKGIEDLVPAFTQLAQRFPQLQLVGLGLGISESTFRAAFPASCQSQLIYRQTANDLATAAEFAAADIFLLPSLFEGTPLTLMEAMLSGLPIVTTATCGMKDVIKDQDNGLLIPLRDPAAIEASISKLLINPDLRARLGRQAQQDAQTFYSWEKTAQVMQQLYETLLLVNS